MKYCVMEGGVVLCNRFVCVYMRSVSSLWGSELVVGTVWGGECVQYFIRISFYTILHTVFLLQDR